MTNILKLIPPLDSFEVVTTAIWVAIAIVGLLLYRLANRPPSRAEQQRREDDAYLAGYRRGYRKGLECEPHSLNKKPTKEP